MNDPTPVDELLRRYQGGDASAVEELLSRHHEPLHAQVRASMGRLRSTMEVEDVLQEVMLKASLQLGSFPPDHAERLPGWLRRLCENHMHDLRRWQQAKKRHPGKSALRLTPGGSDSEPRLDVAGRHSTPSLRVQRSELSELRERVLAALTPTDFRDVIRLHEELGPDWEEIRTRLERPSAASARELHRRAVVKLTLELEKLYFDSCQDRPGEEGS